MFNFAIEKKFFYDIFIFTNITNNRIELGVPIPRDSIRVRQKRIKMTDSYIFFPSFSHFLKIFGKLFELYTE